jgi:hypothetical protein
MGLKGYLLTLKIYGEKRAFYKKCLGPLEISQIGRENFQLFKPLALIFGQAHV